jgi:hypothetical protein
MRGEITLANSQLSYDSSDLRLSEQRGNEQKQQQEEQRTAAATGQGITVENSKACSMVQEQALSKKVLLEA